VLLDVKIAGSSIDPKDYRSVGGNCGLDRREPTNLTLAQLGGKLSQLILNPRSLRLKIGEVSLMSIGLSGFGFLAPLARRAMAQTTIETRSRFIMH
jgi:hypothetical protein